MTKYKYTIKFYDYWHSGSGLSAGVQADSTVVKTKDGFPFVSAKSVKGLLREMLEESDKNDCFGAEGIGEKIVSTVSDAVLPKDITQAIEKYNLKKELYDKVTTTSIKNGIAKDDSLRTKELTIPLGLEGEIELKDACIDKIEKAMAQVKRLGVGRNRGFGRCSIVLGEKIDTQDEQGTKVEDKSEITLKCTFLSDVVLLGSANTEGKSEVLDFIPGSALLGIVAKGINDVKITSIDFETLLNGSIRLGDATLFSVTNLTYAMPFSFFKPKMADENDAESLKTYNFPYITDKEHTKYQMVQRRAGYIDKDGNLLFPKYHYQQKSSHDTDKRRSQKSGMYGYPAIESETKFLFGIEVDDSNHLKDIVAYLTQGTHRLGKSKSAQYGKVKFEVHSDMQEVSSKTPKDKEQLTFLYVKSRLALFDALTGQPSYEPSISKLGLKSGEIVWEYTQIRTNAFTPYNGAQKTATYERIVIDKGSIIALKNAPEEIQNTLRVGAYQNEGFGEILVNPSFLSSKYFDIEESKKELDEDDNNEQVDEAEKYTGDISLLKFLAKKKENKRIDLAIAERVNDVSGNLKGISNSQWGVIRSMSSKPIRTNNTIKDEVKCYISNGKSADTWKKGGRGEKLLKAIEYEPDNKIRFVKHLAMYMQSLGGHNE